MHLLQRLLGFKHSRTQTPVATPTKHKSNNSPNGQAADPPC
jgi:hypothetical protein